MGFDTYCKNKEQKQPSKYDFDYKPQQANNYDFQPKNLEPKYQKTNFYPQPMDDTLDFKDCL